MVVLETEHYLMEVVGRQEQGFSLGRMVTYTLYITLPYIYN